VSTGKWPLVEYNRSGVIVPIFNTAVRQSGRILCRLCPDRYLGCIRRPPRATVAASGSRDRTFAFPARDPAAAGNR